MMNLSSESEISQRQKIMTFRLTDEQYNEVKDNADLLNLTISDYIRKNLLNIPVPKSAKKPSLDRQILGKLLSQIGRVGNNINQLAKKNNSGVSFEGIRLEKALDEWHELQGAILEAISPSFKSKNENQNNGKK